MPAVTLDERGHWHWQTSAGYERQNADQTRDERIIELYRAKYKKTAIAADVGVSVATVRKVIATKG